MHQTVSPPTDHSAPSPPPRALGKDLKARHVTMISIGGIIGAGLFVGSSASIAAAGPAVIVSYLIAGAIILSVMRMLGEMATAVPGVSSFTEFARLGLGHWAGFVSGWLYWYFWAIVVAIEVIAGSVIVQTFIPLPTWLIGIVLLTAMTATNLMSARHYGEFEYWFASLKVAAILTFLLIAGSYAFGLTSSDGPTFDNWFSHGGFAPNGTVAVLAAVTSVIFALCGAEIATIAAAESGEPARAVARLTTSVVVRIALFYISSMALIVAIVPWNEVQVGYSPFAAALDQMGIPSAAAILQGVVLVAVLSCLNSGLFVTSRVLFTLASHGDAPQALVALSKRRVPARAILLGSAVGYVGVLISFASPDRVFAFLVNASGALMIIIYLIETCAQIRLRRHFEKTDPAALQVRMWLFPALSYLTGAVLIAVLAAMVLIPELASQFYSGVICLAVVVLAYWFRARSGGLSAPLDRQADIAAYSQGTPVSLSAIDTLGQSADARQGS